ncbi:PLC-like phosphodiesterase [Ochromonadaceae sp. CCMP2298]|nr:PLC-like phosphodiesterase [Ochromonadaceae sp. CCMP2298]
MVIAASLQFGRVMRNPRRKPSKQQTPNSTLDNSSRMQMPDVSSYLILAVACYCMYKVACYYPVFWGKKPALGKRGKVEAIAHRGSREEGLPENSVAAFKDAVNAGADIVELDVWLSADGKVVVHHDQTFRRMTAGVDLRRVVDLRHDQMPSLAALPRQAHRVALFGARDCEAVPLLDEALLAVPSPTCLIIEFKQNSDELVAKVLELLRQHNRTQDVYWFSLDEKINKKLRAAEPSIPTITSIPAMLRTLILYHIGVLPFTTIDDAVFGITVDEITLQQIRSEPSLAGLPDLAHQILAFLFRGKPPSAMVAPALFAHLRRRGIPVWFLGVNETSDLQLAVSAGATGVLTDRIAWLKACMAERKMQFSKIE